MYLFLLLLFPKEFHLDRVLIFFYFQLLCITLLFSWLFPLSFSSYSKGPPPCTASEALFTKYNPLTFKFHYLTISLLLTPPTPRLFLLYLNLFGFITPRKSLHLDRFYSIRDAFSPPKASTFTASEALCTKRCNLFDDPPPLTPQERETGARHTRSGQYKGPGGPKCHYGMRGESFALQWLMLRVI